MSSRARRGANHQARAICDALVADLQREVQWLQVRLTQFEAPAASSNRLDREQSDENSIEQNEDENLFHYSEDTSSTYEQDIP